MSTNQGSARDYVKSYVKDASLQDDFLKSEQPQYDPSKPVQPAPAVTDEKAIPTSTNNQPETTFNIHLPTQNPMPSNESETEKAQDRPTIQLTPGDFKEQRKEVHDTALTVCVDLHEELLNCFQHGSWWDKAKMCEEQKQKFWHCYNNQKRFLKDVNYKSPLNTNEEDERILLAAYKLRNKLDKEQAAK
ncbi:hypothetical protein BD560DRAFT_408523 [Blakeslea trispora]|nr:hypothetical protein BD560DRAFT_408523 [Blakeslea trispora]